MALLIDQVNWNSECLKAFDDLEEGNVEAMRITLRLCKQKLENMINKVIDGPIGLVKKSGRHSSAGQSRSSRSRCTNVMSLKISRKIILKEVGYFVWQSQLRFEVAKEEENDNR